MTSSQAQSKSEKKRKDYAFRHQFNEKPSIIPGCPGKLSLSHCKYSMTVQFDRVMMIREQHLAGFQQSKLAASFVLVSHVELI